MTLSEIEKEFNETFCGNSLYPNAQKVFRQYSSAPEVLAFFLRYLEERETKITALQAKLDKTRAALSNLLAESEFVIKGGDNLHDKCIECGLAPIGMLRDSIAQAKTAFEESA